MLKTGTAETAVLDWEVCWYCSRPCRTLTCSCSSSALGWETGFVLKSHKKIIIFYCKSKAWQKTRTCCVTEYLSASTLDWISLLILTSSPGPDSAFCGSVVKPVTHPERGNDRTAKQKEVVHIGLPIAETNNSKQVVRKELYPTCVSGSQDLIIRLFPHTATLDGRHTLRQHLVRKIQGHLASVIWWKEINRHSYLRKVR